MVSANMVYEFSAGSPFENKSTATPVTTTPSPSNLSSSSDDQEISYRSVTGFDRAERRQIEQNCQPMGLIGETLQKQHQRTFLDREDKDSGAVQTIENETEQKQGGLAALLKDASLAASTATPETVTSSDTSSNFDIGSFPKRFSSGYPSTVYRGGMTETSTVFEGRVLYPPESHRTKENLHDNNIAVRELQRSNEANFSNLSLGDMYHTNEDPSESNCKREESTDDLHQHEYFEHDDDDYNVQHGTPDPPSLPPSPKLRAQDEKDLLETPPSSLGTGAKFIRANQLPEAPENCSLQMPSVPSNNPITSASSLVTVDSMVTSSSGGSYYKSNQPVLYSAIGSLEDPTSSSYKGWKSKANAAAKKYEFPSTELFLPPQNRLGQIVDDAMTPAVSNNRKKAERSNHLDDTPKAKNTGPPEQIASPFSEGEEATKKSRKETVEKLPSNLRSGLFSNEAKVTKESNKPKKKVTIDSDTKLKKSKKKKPVIEMFRPSSDAYTPRMGKKEIKYKPAEQRTPVQQMATTLGTLSRPNFRDVLRRVSMIIRQHIVKIERRFEDKNTKQESNVPVSNHGAHYRQRAQRESDGLFHQSMREEFSEDRYITPKYKCTMVRVPMARSGVVCGLKKIRTKYEIPSEAEIYEFAHQLFKKVQLSSECSIVCLIYVERLMEVSKVPLLASTWRPIFMCGLLLASKVWQDLSSWNIEFASVYPQYSLDAINRLELQFLRNIKWELYISSSLYAKYFFALRSLVEKPDFRQRYNRMVGGVNNVKASTARKIEERSSMVKEEVLQMMSRSM